MRQLDQWRASTKWTITLIAIAISTGLLFSAITASPYLYDDLLNKDIRLTSASEGLTLLDQILKYTANWMGAEGRFFPGSLGWSFSIFWVFNSLLAYKLVVASVVSFAIASFSWLIGILLKNVQTAILTWFLLLFLCEIRYWFDGITSFAALIPLTIFFVSISIIVAISSSKWWSIALSGFLFLLPLITYEVVILFTPVAVISIYLKTKSWIQALGITIAASCVGLFSFFLRSNLGEHSPSSAYLITWSPTKFWETFLEQFLAAIPFSQWFLIGEIPPGHALKFLAIVCFLALVPASLALYFLFQTNFALSQKSLVSLTFSGIWIWISSASIVALSGRWQTELNMGQGYLSVIYEYFGLALILTSIYIYISQKIKSSSLHVSLQSKLIMTLSVTLSFLLCLALSTNFVVVNA